MSNTSENWGAEAWRKPTIPEGVNELFSLYGRVIKHQSDNYATDYRSHWLVLWKAAFGGYSLTVKHGGGEETFHLGYDFGWLIGTLLNTATDDARYLILHSLMKVAQESAARAAQATAFKYAKAFLDKRLKRRRRNNKIYVDILAEIKERSPSVQAALKAVATLAPQDLGELP